MKSILILFLNFGFLLVTTSTILLGCTKERPYDAIQKVDGESLKSELVTPGEDYLMTSSSGKTARRAAASRPYWMGRTQRVQFEWTKDHLIVSGVEKDSRFSENTTNQVPLLKFPVTHLAYRCQQDAFGECQNKEEINKEIKWEDRPYVKVQFEDIELLAADTLPIEMRNLGFQCFTQANSKLLDIKSDAEVFTVSLEFVYKVHFACFDFRSISSFEDIFDGSAVTVQRTYTFQKASSTVTPGYQPISYPEGSKDDKTYGYFTTEFQKLDVDNSNNVKSKNVLMNRWHPNQTVVYHMNKEFLKYPKIMEVTRKSFEVVNAGLKKAGTDLRLKIEDPSDSIDPSSLENNMIILVDDPQASGVLGYGPSAVDPLTGEIFSARTVMYLGTMKKFLRRTYEDLIQAEKQKQREQQAVLDHMELFPGLQTKHQPPADPIDEPQQLSSPAPRKLHKHRSHQLRNHSLHKVNELLVDKRSLRDLLKEADGMMEWNIRSTYYPAEMFDFLGVVKSGVDKLLIETQFMPWEELTESQKERVVEILLPYVWVPTFVHELGHNLGLRHNFAGSEDVENFYKPEELKELGLSIEYQYSSVMDYPYGEVDTIPVLGKYDIAALQFGYARKVESTDCQVINKKKVCKLVDVPETLDALTKSLELKMGDTAASDYLKKFDYCTDEQVSPNPNCNRFDRGTNLAEITDHYIKSYEERYKLINFRRNRSSFSLNDDYRHYLRLSSHFLPLRNMFERYENIKNTFKVDDNDMAWTEVEWLRQVRESAVKAGNFYLDILETPDLSCVIVAKDNPNEILGVAKLSDFSPRSSNCYDEPMTSGIRSDVKVIGHFGKLFESKKAQDNPNAFADQIDVRGIWIDKLVAAQMLLKREFGNPIMDRYTESLIDMPELKETSRLRLKNIFMDDQAKAVDIELKDGIVLKNALRARYQLGTQVIHNPTSNRARSWMHLPEGVTSFQEELAEAIERYSSTDLDKNFELVDFASVSDTRSDLSLPVKMTLEVSGRKLYATKSNVVALEIMGALNAIDIGVLQIEDQRLQEIAEAKNKGETQKITPANKAERHALYMDSAVLSRIILKTLPPKEYLEQTLIALADLE